MRLQPQRDDNPEPNLTPLIDVVFLLLIFFMVTTTFEREAQLVLEFPSANQSRQPISKNKDRIEITIDNKGNYFVNHQQLINSSRDALRRALRVAVEGKRNVGSIPVIISAHAKAKHRHVIMAMDASREVGLLNVLFSTVRKKSRK